MEFNSVPHGNSCYAWQQMETLRENPPALFTGDDVTETIGGGQICTEISTLNIRSDWNSDL